LKRKNKEIYFTGKFLPLATCLLMGRPLAAPKAFTNVASVYLPVEGKYAVGSSKKTSKDWSRYADAWHLLGLVDDLTHIL
jgi:hypothetical protein